MTRTDSAVYAFTGDLIDSGVDRALDDLASQGFSAVSLATVYHAARDLLPHNPTRVVAHRAEGAHYYLPDRSLYHGMLHPPAAVDPTAPRFASITSAVAAHDLQWQAWTVYLHNGSLAEQYPEFAIHNAFGDVYLTDLCPSSDAVRDYAVSLTADTAQLAPSAIVAESLHHAGFGHGYHHERGFVELAEIGGFLLSLCFCAACRANARQCGVDDDDVAAAVRAGVRACLSGQPVPTVLSRETLTALCGHALLDYLAARERTVVELADRCTETARAAGVPFAFMDQTGALKGYVSGAPAGALAVDDAWQLGIDPPGVAAAVDSYVVLGYAQDVTRVGDDVAGYAQHLNGASSLRCVLRHGGVDYSGPANLADKVAIARRSGAAAVDFYHYGLMHLAGLDAAAAAIFASSAED
jgi:hypothetical protein